MPKYAVTIPVTIIMEMSIEDGYDTRDAELHIEHLLREDLLQLGDVWDVRGDIKVTPLQ